ncbi:MAG: MFS transporter [Thermaerobacter sp.]|nr:MFS transporter [Thermaerobacter sp.]
MIGSWASLARNRNFLRIWLGTGLSAVGDSAYFILLSWYVVTTSGSSLAVGTTLALTAVPRLVLMMVGGVLADRMSRRVLLTGSLALRCAILIAFTLTGLGHGLVPVYATALAFGLVDAFFWPASGSVLPDVLPAEQLGRGNGVVQTTQQASMVSGPLTATLLLWLPGAWVRFDTLAAIYLASAFILAGLAIAPRPRLGRIRDNPLGDVAAGLRYVSGVPILLILMGISALFNFFFAGPLNVGLPLLVHQRQWPGSDFGYFTAAVGVGGVLGGVLAALANGMRGRFRWFGPIAASLGVSLGLVGVLPLRLFDVVLLLAVGIGLSVITIPINSYLQTVVDPEYLGRTMALLTVSSLGLTPVSYVTLSLLVHWNAVPLSRLVLVGGLLLGAVSLMLSLLPPFRRMEQHPRWVLAGQTGRAKSPPSAELEPVQHP